MLLQDQAVVPMRTIGPDKVVFNTGEGSTEVIKMCAYMHTAVTVSLVHDE